MTFQWSIVDCWTIGTCAELCSSGAHIPSFIFVTFDFLLTWYIGRFWGFELCCDFSCFWGTLLTNKGG